MANYDSITISGSFPASGLIYLDYSSDDNWVTHGRTIDVGIDAPDGATYTQYLLWGYENVTTSGDASWEDIPASGTISVSLVNQSEPQNLHVMFRTAGLEESAVIDSEDISFEFTTPTKSAALSWINLTDEDTTSAILRNTTDNIDITFDKSKLADLKFHNRDFSGVTINNDVITVASGSQIWKLIEHDADGYVSVKKTFSEAYTPFIKANIGDGFKTLTTYSGTIRSDVSGDYLNRIDNYSFDSQSALWGEFFDNTKWSPAPNPWPYATGNWDGEKWVAELQVGGPTDGWYYVAITPSGTWATDFRPTTIRTTVSGNSGVATVYEVYSVDDPEGIPSIVDVSNYNSLDEEAMSFSAGADIGMFLATAQAPFSINTNELFYTPTEKDLTFDVYKFSSYGFATILDLKYTLDSVNTGYINNSIDLKVKVRDTNGEGVENAPVTFSGTGTAIGSFSANPVYTDVNGIATATLNLDTLGSATYDASCDGVHTTTDQITWCYPMVDGQRSSIEQNTQVAESLDYDDAVADTGNSSVSEPSIVSGTLNNDLNVIRTLMKNIKGTTNWFDDLGNYFDPSSTDSGSSDTKTLNLTNIAGHTLDSKTVIIAVEADNSGNGFDVSTGASGILYSTGLSYADQTDRRGIPIFASSSNPGVYWDEGGSDEVCVIDLIDTSTGVEFETAGGDTIYAKFHDGADFGGSGELTDVYIRFYANDAPYEWTASDPTNIMMIFPYRRLMTEMEEHEWARTDFVNGFEGDAELLDDISNLWAFTGAANAQTDPTWTNISGSYILDNNPTDLESAIDLLNTEIGDRTYTTTSGGYLSNGETITESLDAIEQAILSNDNDISTNETNILANDASITSINSSLSTINTDLSDLTSAIGSSTLSGIDYSSNNYVTDGTSIETAIGALDAAVSITSVSKYIEELASDVDANVEHSLPSGAVYTPYSGVGQEGRNMDVWVEGQFLCADTGAAGVNADRDYAETSTSGITFRFNIDAGSNIVYMIYN